MGLQTYSRLQCTSQKKKSKVFRGAILRSVCFWSCICTFCFCLVTLRQLHLSHLLYLHNTFVVCRLQSRTCVIKCLFLGLSFFAGGIANICWAAGFRSISNKHRPALPRDSSIRSVMLANSCSSLKSGFLSDDTGWDLLTHRGSRCASLGNLFVFFSPSIWDNFLSLWSSSPSHYQSHFLPSHSSHNNSRCLD